VPLSYEIDGRSVTRGQLAQALSGLVVIGAPTSGTIGAPADDPKAAGSVSLYQAQDPRSAARYSYAITITGKGHSYRLNRLDPRKR